MSKLKAVVIDDSAQARELLRLMITDLDPDIVICGEAENAAEAIALIHAQQPEIVFLDIEMPGKSGIQLAEELAGENAGCEIIFTTAYNEYAIQAFRLSAIDYLLKPIREQHLREAIQKIRARKNLQHSALRLEALTRNFHISAKQTICVPVNYGYENIPVNDIEYVEAERAYAFLGMTDGKRKLISKNLRHFEEALQHLDFFIKVHRSYLINLHHIARFSRSDRGMITMRSGKEAELSRSHRKAFLEVFEKQKR